jgi:hypothetical protein
MNRDRWAALWIILEFLAVLAVTSTISVFLWVRFIRWAAHGL